MPKRTTLVDEIQPKEGETSSSRQRSSLQRLLFPTSEEPLPEEVGFTTRLLVATTLPHSKPADNEFTRSSGFYDLCLLAPRRIGLPYGRYPRLILVWLISEAVRRKTPLIYLPESLTQLAYGLGITPSCGPKGTLAQLREQLHRVVNVNFSCLGNQSLDSSFNLAPAFSEGGGLTPVKRYLLWWDEPPPDSENRSFILLNEDFFQEVLAHPIPVSLEVIRSFRSPFEMDIYMWLTWRSVRSLRIQRPETVSWAALEMQFGSDYTEVRSFRFNFLRAVKNVLKVYPTIRMKSNRRGLVILPFPPHVPPRRVK